MLAFFIITIIIGGLACGIFSAVWEYRAAIWESIKNDIKKDFTITWFK